MQRQLKKSLNQVIAGCYISPAVTVLTVGRTTPLQLSATTDAASVFFVVAALYATAYHFMAWCIHTGCTAYQIVVHSRMHHVTTSMVALAGPTSVGPVSDNAGSGIPVRAIASEHTTSCDSMIQCYRRLPPWLLPQPQNTQNPRFPNSVTTVVVSVGVRVKNTVKNHCADLVLRDIVSLLLQIQQPGLASCILNRCQNTHPKRVFCCLMSLNQWWVGQGLLWKRRVAPVQPVTPTLSDLPPVKLAFPVAVKKTLNWRLPSWLQPQPQNTQNPRSPNSVTTVAVSFIAHRWWYFICTSSIWTVMKKRCSCIFLTFFPTSTTILRL